MLRSTLGRHAARAIRACMLAELAQKHLQLLTDNIAKGDYTVWNQPVFPRHEIEAIGGRRDRRRGDDGVGPYVAHLLESRYKFEDGVEIADLGTPALDLLNRIAEKDAVVLIDCVDAKASPGTVLLYRKPDLIRYSPGLRMGPHSPALTETLLTADFWGLSPTELLLVGITPESFESGCALSDSVRASLDHAVAQVLCELDRLHIKYKQRKQRSRTSIWWTKNETPGSYQGMPSGMPIGARK